ncbi:hypothetical protein BKA70DRAFT_1269035 [Coprinopsis sp. MPI-PUGE-AT-0042]|nr:hypothetical protein BKA70DRAFT_1269035 [Coprinopsis sp. MPI-PUGE-AT-0042]
MCPESVINRLRLAWRIVLGTTPETDVLPHQSRCSHHPKSPIPDMDNQRKEENANREDRRYAPPAEKMEHSAVAQKDTQAVPTKAPPRRWLITAFLPYPMATVIHEVIGNNNAERLLEGSNFNQTFDEMPSSIPPSAHIIQVPLDGNGRPCNVIGRVIGNTNSGVISAGYFRPRQASAPEPGHNILSSQLNTTQVQHSTHVRPRTHRKHTPSSPPSSAPNRGHTHAQINRSRGRKAARPRQHRTAPQSGNEIVAI